MEVKGNEGIHRLNPWFARILSIVCWKKHVHNACIPVDLITVILAKGMPWIVSKRVDQVFLNK